MNAHVRTARLAFVLLCLMASAGLGAQNPSSQSAQPTFRTSSDYVQVSVQARDRKGRPVSDLSRTDLELFEDGKPLEIATFAPVNLPVERRAVARAGATVTAIGETAWATNATTTEGRTFVLFVDAMHVAAERTVPMRRLLKQFVTENMGDNDIAAVVVTGGLTPSQDFTGDKATLVAAIDRITGDRLPSRMLTKWRHKVNLAYDYIRDDYAGERANRAQQSLSSLRRVVQMLTGLGGRRTAVLYLSEGFDIDLNDRIGSAKIAHLDMTAGRDGEAWANTALEANYAGQVADELQLTVEASTRANVSIYTMDPRGLADGEEQSMQVAGMGTNSTGTQVDPFLPTSLFRAESVRMQQNLRDLAGRTGGRAIVNTNNFATPLADVMDDASHYYVLSYRMTHRDDGRFHRITVRTSRPGITLSSRDGYYSPRAGAKAHAARSPLAALLESPIQLPGLTMSAASTVIPAAKNSTVRFAVEFSGEALGSGASATPVIELAYVLTNEDGRVLDQGEKTLRLAVSKEMRASLEDHGLRYVAEMTAPPGRHHIRLAAQNHETQALGSLFWDVDVPVIPPSDVALSPLVLTSQQSDAMPTISDVPQASKRGDGLMTARRAFTSEDVLSISTLVANGRKAGELLTAAFVVSTDEGREVARKDVNLPDADRGSELAAFSQRVALDTLAPGRYRADFVVRSSNGRVRAERALLFEVERSKGAISLLRANGTRH